MKILITVLFLALVGATIWTIRNDGFVSNQEEERAHVTPIQESTRGRKKAGGASHASMDPGTLLKLRESWQALLPAHGESLFDEEEVAKFLASLNQEETKRLATDFLEQPSYNKDAASRLIGRWAEFDVFEAIDFLEAGNHRNPHVFSYLYLGWAKANLSTSEFESEKNVNLMMRGFSNNEWVKGQIMSQMTRIDPQGTLEILLARAQSSEGESEAKASVTERDAVIREMPIGSNWNGIAERLRTKKFNQDLGESGAYMQEMGPGGMVFARWATETPEQAFDWFGQSASDKNASRISTMPYLLLDWYDHSPESAETWIESKLKTGKKEEIVTWIEQVTSNYLPDARWLEWGQLIEHQDSRFSLLEAAAQSKGGSYSVGINDSGEHHSFSEHTYGIDPTVIKRLLPHFNLTPKHEQKIIQILKDRESKE